MMAASASSSGAQAEHELVGRLVPADYSAPVELPSLAEREGRQLDHPPAL